MKEQDAMTATQAELDATAYDAYARNGENKAAAARELGINPSTVSDRIKRHLARTAQDEAVEPETAEQAPVTAVKAGYEGAVCPECDAITYAYADGHFTDCRYHKLNAAAAGYVAKSASAAADVPEPDTADDPQAQTEHDALMSQACGDCGVEVDFDGGKVEHLDNCPADSAPAAEVYPVAVAVDGTVVAMTRRVDIAGQDDDTDELAARPGPGQAEDNIVHQMACGHEYDSPVELGPGQPVQCSAHGPTEIIGAGPEPAPRAETEDSDAEVRKAMESTQPAAQPAQGKPGRFPEGVVTPKEFRAALVAEGIVPEKSVHYLGYKLANENPGSFPARWYAKDGTAYDYGDRQPGGRLGIHLAGGREWVKNRPAKPARQPRAPKAKAVLFEDGKPSARLASLLGSDGGGQAELTSSDVSTLYAAYAGMTAAGGTLRGFAGWLGEIG